MSETESPSALRSHPETPKEPLESPFQTTSGIAMKRLYEPEDAPQIAGRGALPGDPPYARGLYPQGYRRKLWTMRMYCGYGTPQETNKRFHYLIQHGETGLSLAFDLPTQIGLDPDDAAAKGEVGKVGVSIAGIWDFEELMKGIDLTKISLSMTINATAFILYAFYFVLAKKRGLDPRLLRGTLQNDLMKEFIARGTYAYAPEPSLRFATDLIEFSLAQTPHIYPISISGYHMREAGATAVDELAFTMANAMVYLDALKQRGVSLSAVLGKLSFFFGVHNHMLEEIAKFRAARVLWARLLKTYYGVEGLETAKLRFHAQTCGSTLTSEEPLNNAVRVALQAMSAVLGGAQSLHTNSYDEALALPAPEAQLLALRTQQILALETGVVDCADPLGGAYAIEALTGELLERAWRRLQDITARGGMLEALKRGFPQQALAESAYRYQTEMDAGKIPIVGVNILRGQKASRARTFRVAAALERTSIRQLRQQRKQRQAQSLRPALAQLKEAAAKGVNILPATIAAVEKQATLGEIAGALRETVEALP